MNNGTVLACYISRLVEAFIGGTPQLAGERSS